MGTYDKNGGYSADVRIHLRVNGEMIPVSHLEPESIILRSNFQVPFGPATLVIVIDGRTTERQIILSEAQDEMAVEHELSYAAAPSGCPF